MLVLLRFEVMRAEYSSLVRCYDLWTGIDLPTLENRFACIFVRLLDSK
jgi:hypothetical protein